MCVGGRHPTKCRDHESVDLYIHSALHLHRDVGNDLSAGDNAACGSPRLMGSEEGGRTDVPCQSQLRRVYPTREVCSGHYRKESYRSWVHWACGGRCWWPCEPQSFHTPSHWSLFPRRLLLSPLPDKQFVCVLHAPPLSSVLAPSAAPGLLRQAAVTCVA